MADIDHKAGNQHTQLKQAGKWQDDHIYRDIYLDGSYRRELPGGIQQIVVAAENTDLVQIISRAVIEHLMQRGCIRESVIADMLDGAGQRDLFQ